MKHLFLNTFFLFITTTFINAQNWQLDKSHSSVNFSITHMVVSETAGNFKNFTADVKAKEEDFSDMKVNFSIDASSVNTDDEARDKHLRGADFFEAEKFPKITFESTELVKVKGNVYRMMGKMTMKGVTKEVEWTLRYNGTIKGNNGNIKAGFKAMTTIKRSDFNMSWNKLLDVGGVALSDEVEVVVNIELNKM
jgi:polyisoprenoid-binding protein YceI